MLNSIVSPVLLIVGKHLLLHKVILPWANYMGHSPKLIILRLTSIISKCSKTWIESVLQDNQTFLKKFKLIHNDVLINKRKNSPGQGTAGFGALLAPTQPLLRVQSIHVSILQSMGVTPM